MTRGVGEVERGVTSDGHGGRGGRADRASGEAERTGVDRQGSVEGKRRAAQGERAHAILNEGKVILVGAGSADAAGEGGVGDLADRQHRSGRSAADNRVRGHAGERRNRLVAGAADAVAELQHGVGGKGEVARAQAVVGAAVEDDPVGALEGRRAEVAGGSREGQVARTGLGEAPCPAGADGGSEDDVITIGVEGGSAVEETDGARGRVEDTAELQGAAREDEAARGPADLVQRVDLQHAFVDRRPASTAAGRIGDGKHQSAAAGLGDVSGGRERRSNRRGQRLRSACRIRIDDMDNVLGSGAGRDDTVAEAPERDAVITGRRRVTGEEHGPAGDRKALADTGT